MRWFPVGFLLDLTTFERPVTFLEATRKNVSVILCKKKRKQEEKQPERGALDTLSQGIAGA